MGGHGHGVTALPGVDTFRGWVLRSAKIGDSEADRLLARFRFGETPDPRSWKELDTWLIERGYTAEQRALAGRIWQRFSVARSKARRSRRERERGG